MRIRKSLAKWVIGLNRRAEKEYEFLQESQWLPAEKVADLQNVRLEKLLLYAYAKVPFYRQQFEQYGLVHNGKIRLERFETLPVLDKPLIRAHAQELTSSEVTRLKAHSNKTSGSTGEPLVFLQDRYGVQVSGGVVLRLFYAWHGIEPGDKEIRLWGSEADLFYKDRVTLETLRMKLNGLRLLNAFRMTPERMRDYIQVLNTYQPRLLRGYSSNLYELAQFAQENRLKISPPQVVISSAGTLYEPLRQKMAEVYGSLVANHYGAREMHHMAMECPQLEGLHISSLTHRIEVVDESNQPCPPGVEGDLLVTSLFNYAMPFIRYKIGDRGVMSEKNCSCGRGLPMLSRLSGRRVECFRTRAGTILPGEYFIYLLAVHLENNPINKYQVIQDDFDHIRFNLSLRSGRQLDGDMQHEIEEKTRLVMGEKCLITFEFVDDIPTSKNGKYSYTICNLQ